MEESLKVGVLGQVILISMQELSNIKPLITKENLREIRFPSCLSKFQPHLDVLHSCLYYLISVQNNLKHTSSSDFREKCLERISEYYIKQKMNFQLYGYGYLSGKILQIPIDKAMHIIYFLIYTRLASKPYIDSVIARRERRGEGGGEGRGAQLRRRTTAKSQKQFSIQSRALESRHMTIFFDSSQMETEVLKKQLKKIMSPPTNDCKKTVKKTENKRYFNLRKIYPDDADLKEESRLEQEQCRSTASSRVATVPVKVNGNQNSSVIARLKLKSGQNNGEEAFKKVRVRRQKFNQWFDSAQAYHQLTSDCGMKENKRIEQENSKQIFQKDQKSLLTNNKNQKHPFQYYQDLTSLLRSKNQQLDSIRYQCFHHTDKSANPHKQPDHNLYDRGILFNKYTIKTESSKIQNESTNSRNLQSNRQMFNWNPVRQEYLCLKTEKLKDCSHLSKTASVSKCSTGEMDHLVSVITRKDENRGCEDESPMTFNKEVQNKLRLQKYKQQYRTFLKTQMFERVKAA